MERLAVFAQQLFATPHDQANRAAVHAAELNFAGIALRAHRETSAM